MPHRAYCLDIVAAAATHEWFWADDAEDSDDPAAHASGRDPSHGAGCHSHTGGAQRARQQLLRGVVGRCHDAAPAVRVRALGALGALLEQVRCPCLAPFSSLYDPYLTPCVGPHWNRCVVPPTKAPTTAIATATATATATAAASTAASVPAAANVLLTVHTTIYNPKRRRP